MSYCIYPLKDTDPITDADLQRIAELVFGSTDDLAIVQERLKLAIQNEIVFVATNDHDRDEHIPLPFVGIAILTTTHTIKNGREGTVHDFAIWSETGRADLADRILKAIIAIAMALKMERIYAEAHELYQNLAYRMAGFDDKGDGHFRLNLNRCPDDL